MSKQRKEKILIVDDEENIRKSLRMIFEYDDYTVLEAADGEEALKTIDETVGLDLVLLDIKLPGLDGLEVLAELKKRPYSPEVIMISGHGTVHTAVEATKLGAFDFFEKPLHRERVLLSIRNALSQNRLARAMSVPPRRINEIVHGKRAVTADTAIRLALALGTSEQFWMGLQADFDLEEAKKSVQKELNKIENLAA